jgi:UPF0716 protein FxsA
VGPLLVVMFLLVPIVEIYVIIQVGQLIGPLPTIALLIVESLIGAWLLKREGRAAWLALQRAVGSGRLPGRELVDAGLVLVGGTLLVAPGFITDVVGFFFILPPTRPLARRLLLWLMARRAARLAALGTPWAAPAPTGWRPSTGRPSARTRRSGQATPPRVVRGELVADSPGVEQHVDETGPDDPAPDDKNPGRAAGG